MSSGQFIKIVIVGPSGAGKTSLRHQYISGRFTTGYRATIGTDFITKTVPHYSKPRGPPSRSASEASSTSDLPGTSPRSELPTSPSTPGSVTLQIWDTAGQERFSSLSTAFFRGADAVILVFDVNKPESLQELSRWWDEFRTKVPIQEQREAEYCTVVVGNKTDLVGASRHGGKKVVDQSSAEAFLRDLIPTFREEPSETSLVASSPGAGPSRSVVLGSEPPSPAVPWPGHPSAGADPPNPKTESPAEFEAPVCNHDSISGSQSTPRLSQLRKQSDDISKFGTINTVRTEASIYHTPSSSFLDSRLHSRDNSVSPSELASRNVSRIRGTKPHGTLERIPSTGSNMDFEMDMDIDPTQDGDTSYNSTSAGYVTAKSNVTQSVLTHLSDQSTSSAIPMMTRPGGKDRPRIASILSDSSMSTVKPIMASNSRDGFLYVDPLTQSSHSFSGLPPSPPRSRASTRSSASTNITETAQEDHAAHATLGLPTPSASPPSPQLLNASLIATMHQAHAQEMEAAKLAAGPKKLDVGPKLFFTSAKTGGVRGATDAATDIPVTPVTEIFEYLAERVVRRWEWEDEAGEPAGASLNAGSDVQPGSRRSRFTFRLLDGMLGNRHDRRGGCCT